MARNIRKMVIKGYELTYVVRENGEFKTKKCYTNSSALRAQLNAIKEDSGLSDTSFMFDKEQDVKELDSTYYIIDINKAIDILLENGLAVTEKEYNANSRV